MSKRLVALWVRQSTLDLLDYIKSSRKMTYDGLLRTLLSMYIPYVSGHLCRCLNVFLIEKLYLSKIVDLDMSMIDRIVEQEELEDIVESCVTELVDILKGRGIMVIPRDDEELQKKVVKVSNDVISLIRHSLQVIYDMCNSRGFSPRSRICREEFDGTIDRILKRACLLYLSIEHNMLVPKLNQHVKRKVSEMFGKDLTFDLISQDELDSILKRAFAEYVMSRVEVSDRLAEKIVERRALYNTFLKMRRQAQTMTRRTTFRVVP